jgi:hypothetical protein
VLLATQAGINFAPSEYARRGCDARRDPCARCVANVEDEPMNRERRVFMLGVSAISATAAASLARAQAHLDEKDPQAVALGYAEDSAKVDETKFPKHAASQNCSRCALGQFRVGETWANCQLFAGRQVNANGWCSAFVKRGA